MLCGNNDRTHLAFFARVVPCRSYIWHIRVECRGWVPSFWSAANKHRVQGSASTCTDHPLPSWLYTVDRYDTSNLEHAYSCDDGEHTTRYRHGNTHSFYTWHLFPSRRYTSTWVRPTGVFLGGRLLGSSTVTEDKTQFFYTLGRQ
jgi:hypothetical protein